jgi:hypothetical protein
LNFSNKIKNFFFQKIRKKLLRGQARGRVQLPNVF